MRLLPYILAFALPANASNPSFVATAVSGAIASITAVAGDVTPYRDPVPTKWELTALYTQAVREADKASEWSGVTIPPAAAWVIAQKESHHKNLMRHCDGGSDKPNERSIGYFCMTSDTFATACKSLGESCPCRAWFLSTDEWRKGVCWYAWSHPEIQVEVFFQRFATYLREGGGNLYAAFSMWRWGTVGPSDYAADCARIWAHKFEWPPNGQLTPLGRGR